MSRTLYRGISLPPCPTHLLRLKGGHDIVWSGYLTTPGQTRSSTQDPPAAYGAPCAPRQVHSYHAADPFVSATAPEVAQVIGMLKAQLDGALRSAAQSVLGARVLVAEAS